MSSAEDMKLLATSPTAESTEPPFEESPVELEEVESSPPIPKPLLKTNMVAHEVRVTATFAPPDKNAVDRELSTEETTSVLICETGGVIQLSAAVSNPPFTFDSVLGALPAGNVTACGTAAGTDAKSGASGGD